MRGDKMEKNIKMREYFVRCGIVFDKYGNEVDKSLFEPYKIKKDNKVLN